MATFTRGWPHAAPAAGAEPLSLLAEALSRAPLFAGLSQRHLRGVARVARVSSHPAGAAIVTEGTQGSAMYVILEGTTRVVRGRRKVARLRPGDFFGEISVLDAGPRTASVVAEGPVRCVRLEGADLRRLLLRDPRLALRVLSELARRLRGLERPAAG